MAKRAREVEPDTRRALRRKTACIGHAGVLARSGVGRSRDFGAIKFRCDVGHGITARFGLEKPVDQREYAARHRCGRRGFAAADGFAQII